MCKHEFGKEYEARLSYQIENPFYATESNNSKRQAMIDRERHGLVRTCEKCGLTQFTTNIKNITVGDWE